MNASGKTYLEECEISTNHFDAAFKLAFIDSDCWLDLDCLHSKTISHQIVHTSAIDLPKFYLSANFKTKINSENFFFMKSP